MADFSFMAKLFLNLQYFYSMFFCSASVGRQFVCRWVVRSVIRSIVCLIIISALIDCNGYHRAVCGLLVDSVCLSVSLRFSHLKPRHIIFIHFKRYFAVNKTLFLWRSVAIASVELSWAKLNWTDWTELMLMFVAFYIYEIFYYGSLLLLAVYVFRFFPHFSYKPPTNFNFIQLPLGTGTELLVVLSPPSLKSKILYFELRIR